MAKAEKKPVPTVIEPSKDAPAITTVEHPAEIAHPKVAEAPVHEPLHGLPAAPYNLAPLDLTPEPEWLDAPHGPAKPMSPDTKMVMRRGKVVVKDEVDLPEDAPFLKGALPGAGSTPAERHPRVQS
jgi:hypothetical protein